MKFQQAKDVIKKAVAVAVVSILTPITLTACSFQFSETSGGKADNITDVFVEAVETVVDNSDLKNESDLQDLTDALISLSDGYAEAEEDIGKFQKVSLSRVVDGDTIVVDIEGDSCGNKEHEYKVRLIGVNTPESVASQEYLDRTGKENTKEGKDASEFTKSLLEDTTLLYLEKDVSDTDRYDRLLRYVWLEVPENECDIDEISSKMLNGILLKEHVAEVTIYRPDVKYADCFAAIEAGTEDDFEIDR